ncbi:MAG: VRR-NUC domain-containing protein [Fusobacteriaceae bacterium]
MEREKKLEKDLNIKIKNKGGITFKMLSTHFTGLPDRICLFPGGRLCFIELKTTGKKPTKIQLMVHQKLRDLGFDIRVIDNTEKINNLLKDYE